MIPVSTQTNPTGVKEKNERLSNPAFSKASCTTRLGGVPIRVAIPPMLLAKARGIRKRLGFMLAFIAILTTMGNIRATVPVLLTKAPMKAVTTIIKMNNFNSLFPANWSILLLIILARPVLKMAPPTTNKPTIMITIGFEKPDNASSGVKILQTMRSTSAQSATRSERIFPFTKNKAESAKMTRVVIIKCY